MIGGMSPNSVKRPLNEETSLRPLNNFLNLPQSSSPEAR